MAANQQTGKSGEAMAAAYFEKQGYELLHQNWRHRHWEIDIIAHKNGILHFIEVKTRKGNSGANPEEKVDPKKIRYLIDASAEYLYLYPRWQRVQFDVLSIHISNEQATYFLIEDVYTW